jgi:G protein-coupled glucose receptor regulating Gpa2 C-term
VAITAMLYFMIMVIIRIRKEPDPQRAALFMRSLKKLVWYPLIYIFCWTLPTVMDIYTAAYFQNLDGQNTHITGSVVLYFLLPNVLPALQAPLSALAFFNANRIVRVYWYSWFRERLCSPKDDEQSDFQGRLSEESLRLEEEEDYTEAQETDLTLASAMNGIFSMTATVLRPSLVVRPSTTANPMAMADAPASSFYFTNSSFRAAVGAGPRVPEEIEMHA